MEVVPQWLVYAVGSFVPLTAFIGFWMALSSRITRAETSASIALDESRAATVKAALLAKDMADYREKIAREYIHIEVMKDIRDTLTLAVDRLGDRLDRYFEKQSAKE